jgi:hypothetical protein
MFSLFIPSSRPPARIVHDPVEVEAMLRDLFGFGVEQCHQALAAGHARAALATANSAQGQFGSDFYFGVIEELRNQVAAIGYESRRFFGLELARRSDNSRQITTCMASDGAGELSGSPRPKNPKGSSSKKAVHDNQGTLGMLDPGAQWDPIETWWLLPQLHGDGQTRSITSEVSLPNDMRSGRDFDWETRIILPILELNDNAAPALPEPAKVVDVPIVRRVS